MTSTSFLFPGILLLSATFATAQLPKTYSTKEYSIGYPDTWRLDTSRTQANAILFFSPLEGQDDAFDENVNILTQDLRGKNIDLKKYKEISDGQVSSMGEGAKIIKSEIQDTPAGKRFYFETYLTMYGNHLHTRAYCRIKAETAYLVTLTTTTVTFDRYDSLGTAILGSFRLK